MALRRAASSLGLSMRALPASGAMTRGSADAFRGALTRWMSTFADNVKYAPTHEWAKLEGDTVTVGISDHAQSELGDVVYVELPEVGSQVTKGEAFGVVESVKSASDVYSPVDGEVVEVNGGLADDPAKLNADAFGGGWMMKVKVGGAGATDGLLDAAAYKKSVGA